MIPADLHTHIEQTLGLHIDSARRVSGGSINRAAQISLSDGRSCFLKWNESSGADMFLKEEKGLQILRAAETSLVIPEVLAGGQSGEGTGFLLQEHIPKGNANPHSAEEFGRELAALHRQSQDQYGLDHNNYIGSLPQSNRQHTNWIDFFVEERLEPQLKRAQEADKINSTTTSRLNSLYRQLPDIFPEEPPGLLHGDLWSGNFFYDDAGRAAIYDPAVYYGHREIELAFTHLFGGFSGNFYRAYGEAYPLEPGFEARKDIYNLYPLLVHVNLFGGSYVGQVKTIVNQF